jgi:hypothetical protein
MGLERRNGGLYYYRKRRVGRSVRSEYVGGGMLAEFAARLDEEDRDEARQQAAAVKAEWDAKRAALDAEEARVAGYLHAIDRTVSQALEAAGYHRPSRRLQWMKRQGRSPSPERNDHEPAPGSLLTELPFDR